MDSVCVFCGSAAGLDPAYVDAARAVGTRLARSGRRVVYGGASIGIMGAVADAALAEGGEVVGVLPEALVQREVMHAGLTEMLVVDSMHTRKARMAELSDAFLVLPGGLGTLEELFEVWTWIQLGIYTKPIGLLDVDGYWKPLAAFVDHAVEQGFVKPEHRRILHTRTAVDDVLAVLERAVRTSRVHGDATGMGPDDT